MKQTVNFYDFKDAFNTMDRGNQFTYEGLQALFHWLEDFEEGTGQEIELDVIALCCDFREYDDLSHFWEYYDKEDYPDLQSIEDSTVVIPLENGGLIIQNF